MSGVPNQGGGGLEFPVMGGVVSSRGPLASRATVRVDLKELFNRPPPASPEAEMSLLGAMLIDPRAVGDIVLMIPTGGWFYDQRHGVIYDAMVQLSARHQSGDLVQLAEILRDKHVLDDVGGIDYLYKLASETISAAHAKYYARIVREKHQLRELIQAAGMTVHEAYHATDLGDDGAREVLDRAEGRIFKIAEHSIGMDIARLPALLQAEMERMMADEGKSITGVSSGFHDLDELTSGLQRGEMVVVAARPSMGKCLDSASEIVLADGSVRTIEEIHRARTARLLTLKDDWKLGITSASDFIDDGLKPVFEVTTRLGRRVRTTLTHPFRTLNGWTPLGEIKVGDHVAVPRRIGVFGKSAMPECRVKLLAYLLGDGGLTGSVPRFTNSSSAVLREFRGAVEAFGGVTVSNAANRADGVTEWRVVADTGEIERRRDEFAGRLAERLMAVGLTRRDLARAVGVSPASVKHWASGATVPQNGVLSRVCETLATTPEQLVGEDADAARMNSPNAVTRWLTDLGLMGKGSHDKFIPACVFTLKKPLLAAFLSRLFATDGWASVLASGQPQIGFASVSERMVRQVQHLLLRFGVIAAVRERRVKYAGGRRTAWQLDLSHQESILTFGSEIGIFGKEKGVRACVGAVKAAAARVNRDLVPAEVWHDIDAAREGLSWRQVGMKLGLGEGANLHVAKRGLSRARLAKIAKVLKDKPLARLAESDVYWDRVVSIRPLGRRQVYDLTIPGTHNFVADDVCVHNTALALNLAEQIAFGGSPHDERGPHTPVAVFSMEMSRQQLVQRLICARSGVDSHKMRRNMLNAEEVNRVMQACGELNDAPIFIDDTPGLSVMALRAKARRLAAQFDIRCIVIDYLQLMSAPQSAKENRQQEVSAISRGVKALARELNLPVICLAQLNRAAETREGHRPRMGDLRESGSIEQDADTIMLLHREDYYHVGDEAWLSENQDKIGVAELIIAKQRNGPTDTVKLTWDRTTTRFKNYTANQWAPPAAYSGGGGGGGGAGGGRPSGGYSGGPANYQAPRANPYAGEAGAAGGHSGGYSGFAPGKKSGPEQGFRDGGGPDSMSEMAEDDLPI